MAENTKKKVSIIDDMAYRNTQLGEVENTARKIRKSVKKPRKCNGGSCVPNEDRRSGAPNILSRLDVAIENIKHRAMQVNVKRQIRTLTDLILHFICEWPNIAKNLADSGEVDKNLIFTTDNRVRFAVVWMTRIIKTEGKYRELLKQVTKKEGEEAIEEMKKDISSLFSQAFKSFELLGLAKRDEEEIINGRTRTYFFSPKLGSYSLGRLNFLVRKGRALLDQINRVNKRSKLEVPAEEIIESMRENGKKTQTLKLLGPGRIKNASIKEFPDGTVEISITFQ